MEALFVKFGHIYRHCTGCSFVQHCTSAGSRECYDTSPYRWKDTSQFTQMLYSLTCKSQLWVNVTRLRSTKWLMATEKANTVAKTLVYTHTHIYIYYRVCFKFRTPHNNKFWTLLPMHCIYIGYLFAVWVGGGT